MNFDNIRIAVTTINGLENILARELEVSGVKHININSGFITGVATKDHVYTLNAGLYTAFKILILVDNVPFVSERELYSEIKKLNWNSMFSSHMSFKIEFSGIRESYNKSKYLASIVKDAIVDSFRDHTLERPAVEKDDPDLWIQLHFEPKGCSVYLNSSGISLHKRGYRKKRVEAPMNEVLAAGIVMLSGWDKKDGFVDPMCGSGTIAIEAALQRYGVLPNLNRRKFGFEGISGFSREEYLEVTQKNGSSSFSKNEKDGEIVLADKSKEAFEAANANIQECRLDHVLHCRNHDFFELKPPKGNGTVIINPPYDKRLDLPDINDFYKRVGDRLKHEYSGWKALIYSANVQALKKVGLRTDQKIHLKNGGLDGRLHFFTLY